LKIEENNGEVAFGVIMFISNFLKTPHFFPKVLKGTGMRRY
jgi:hypothetical protein